MYLLRDCCRPWQLRLRKWGKRNQDKLVGACHQQILRLLEFSFLFFQFLFLNPPLSLPFYLWPTLWKFFPPSMCVAKHSSCVMRSNRKCPPFKTHVFGRHQLYLPIRRTCRFFSSSGHCSLLNRTKKKKRRQDPRCVTVNKSKGLWGMAKCFHSSPSIYPIDYIFICSFCVCVEGEQK